MEERSNIKHAVRQTANLQKNLIAFALDLSMLSIKEGEFLVKATRRAVKEYLETGKYEVPETNFENLKVNGGVFVTIKKGDELKGCIGNIQGTQPLINATCSSAISAATGDPRFKPLTLEELSGVSFEISVLTIPEEIVVMHPQEYPTKIKVGRDGLIIKHGPWSGLLLPQVPVEWGWDAEEFLNNLCMKANLPITTWLDKKTKLYSFQAQVFKEKEPNGTVEEEKLS